MAHDGRNPHVFVDGAGNTIRAEEVMDNYDVLWTARDALAVPGRVVAGGSTHNPGAGSRTNTAYGALSDAADQVTGLVLPSNKCVVRLNFQAQWAESVNNTAKAAIFIGANQLKVAQEGVAAPAVQETAIGTGGSPNIATPLTTFGGGLTGAGAGTTAFTGNVSTGQALGAFGPSFALNFGVCEIFGLAAATYTISVQYKSSSGQVAVADRHLSVSVLDYA